MGSFSSLNNIILNQYFSTPIVKIGKIAGIQFHVGVDLIVF